MDSNTAIGTVTKFLLITTDTLGNRTETTINTNLKPNDQATYANVYNGFQALTALLTNTYADVTNVTNISVNEIMAG